MEICAYVKVFFVVMIKLQIIEHCACKQSVFSNNVDSYKE